MPDDFVRIARTFTVQNFLNRMGFDSPEGPKYSDGVRMTANLLDATDLVPALQAPHGVSKSTLAIASVGTFQGFFLQAPSDRSIVITRIESFSPELGIMSVGDVRVPALQATPGIFTWGGPDGLGLDIGAGVFTGELPNPPAVTNKNSTINPLQIIDDVEILVKPGLRFQIVSKVSNTAYEIQYWWKELPA